VALDVDVIAVAGEWIRHAPRAAGLLGRSIRPLDGRWQRGVAVRGLYLADEPVTATAEWYRALAERALPPHFAIPHDHHRWRVAVEVADLGTAERLAAVGLAPPRPPRRAWPAYQRIGEKLWRAGWAGLLAPSAARPDGKVLCLFADSWPPDGCRPLRAERIEQLPALPQGHEDLTRPAAGGAPRS
jgi:RES domain-containing protein